MLRVAEHFEHTDTGRQRRTNEDSSFARAPVFAVADGMGGARAGEVASRIAVEVFEQPLSGEGAAEQRLAERVREANARIHEVAGEDTRRAGMGTTLTAAYVGEADVSLAHVGDSRAYRLREGLLERLTRDHSLVEELVRRGKLTEQQADEHPQRSVITRALGPEATVEVDTRTFPARAGDLFLLCSDGLTSMVSEARLGEILRDAESLGDAGHRLVDEANEQGGRDNITVVLFRLEAVGGAQDAAIDQPTQVGAPAPTAEQIAGARAAAAATPEIAAPDAGAPEAAEPPRRTVRLPRAPVSSRRRRLRPGLIAAAVLVAALLAGGWTASRAVYFVGSDAGFVTVYRGLPYELPAGLHLYQRYYSSGVAVDELSPARRRTILDHSLRSHDDASDLVRELELGRIRQ